MKNKDVIETKLETALCYLYEQEEKIKPFLEILQRIMHNKIKEQEVSLSDAFKMYVEIQKQYTDSILLITKIQEIINFSD